MQRDIKVACIFLIQKEELKSEPMAKQKLWDAISIVLWQRTVGLLMHQSFASVAVSN
jgi:hypothetical protein